MTLLWIVLLPFLGCLPPLLLRGDPADRRRIAWSAAVPAIAAFALLLGTAPRVFGGETLTARWSWIPALGLDFTIRLDGLSWFFAFLVLGIGLLILLYARYYLSSRDPAGRFYAMLMLFMGSMLGLVVSGNLLIMVVFWEMTSISSFLLIGYWSHLPHARRGARMALAVTGMGGLALLAGVILIGRMVGSFDLAVVLDAGDVVRADPLYRTALVLVLLGAFTKSAQFPFHFWLPNAMAAPTPVSAYLHSATMVKAGVFLLARLYPVLSGTPEWFYIVGGVGAATLLLGAYTAMWEHDLKGLLAYSTVSHLGLITLLFGFSTQLAAIAAVFHIINHATFKAGLFMSAGIIDHEAGTRDMRLLSGLRRYMPYTSALAIVAAAAMAGVPLLNGFLSKEMFFAESLIAVGPGGPHAFFPIVATLGGAFSVAYSVRFCWDVFFGDEPRGIPKVPHEPPRWMRIPVEVLVAICVLVGIAPALVVRPLLTLASGAVLNAPVPYYSLSLWHGFNLPLLMTLIAMGAGFGLFAGRRRLYAWHERILPAFRAEHGYDGSVRAMRDLAVAVTRGLENGSLQRYLALLVGAAVVVGVVPAIRLGWAPGPLAAMPADGVSIAAWVVLLVAAVATVLYQHRRLVAIVAISAVGLVVSLAFVRFSAPDLALTQLLVEVATILLLLLALKFLPQQGRRESSAGRVGRDLALAGLAGGGAAALVWAIVTRPVDSIASFFLAESLPGGGGTNVVNVILVDFRGFDTMGEITVIGIAALGVVLMLDRLAFGPGGLGGAAREVRYARDRSPVFLAQISRALMPLALLIAVYLFFRGHNLPGGGFIAGLLAALAIAIQYVASGTEWTDARLPARYPPVIAWGVIIAVATGLGAIVFGAPFLTSAFDHFHLPVVGEFELATAMLFDLGVFLTVVGAVLLIIRRLGELSHGPEVDPSYTREANPWKP